LEIAWKDGGNSTGEEYDRPQPQKYEISKLMNNPSWTTRSEHGKEKPEKVTRSQRRRRLLSACEQNYTKRKSTMKKYK
jgi:hypothetical protein